MSKSLHPSTLFHFTDDINVLKLILTSQYFKISIAREYITSKGPGEKKGSIRNFGVPMVSFCDIRISQLDEHTGKYGGFGLGMNKDWAEKNNLHPVMYMNRQSNLFSLYNRRIRTLKDDLIPLWKSRDSLSSAELKRFCFLKEQYSELFNIIRFMKNYDGRLIRKGRLKDDKYRFADEKEWRFVPPPFHGDLWPSLNYDKIKTNEGKLMYSSKFSDVKLHFDFDDVRYIIVKTEKDAIEIVNMMTYFNCGNDFMRKVITLEQIEADM